jgi:hypothetical protein
MADYAGDYSGTATVALHLYQGIKVPGPIILKIEFGQGKDKAMMKEYVQRMLAIMSSKFQ